MPVALLLFSYGCFVTVNALWLFLTVPWVGLQCVIVVYPDHTHIYGLSATLYLVPAYWFSDLNYDRYILV